MSVVRKIISIPYYDRDEPAISNVSTSLCPPSRTHPPAHVHVSGFLPICFRSFATSLRRGCGFCFLLSLTITPHTYTSPSSAVAQPNVDWIGDILIPTFIISSHWIVLACVSMARCNHHCFPADPNWKRARRAVHCLFMEIICLLVSDSRWVCLLGRRCARSIDMIES